MNFQGNATINHVQRVLAGPSLKNGDSLRILAFVSFSFMAVAKELETYSTLRKNALSSAGMHKNKKLNYLILYK